MPRPVKCRRVCCLPKTNEFRPVQDGDPAGTVVLAVDEYETIRLIDLEGLSQEECGAYMKIARTTVQQIYTVARKKIAKALVNGCLLRIEGGAYKLCHQESPRCACQGCRRQQMNCPMIREEKENAE